MSYCAVHQSKLEEYLDDKMTTNNKDEDISKSISCEI